MAVGPLNIIERFADLTDAIGAAHGGSLGQPTARAGGIGGCENHRYGAISTDLPGGFDRGALFYRVANNDEIGNMMIGQFQRLSFRPCMIAAVKPGMGKLLLDYAADDHIVFDDEGVGHGSSLSAGESMKA